MKEGSHSEGTESVQTARKWGAFDFAVIVTGFVLLFALACASVYGMQYSAVDEGCVPGSVGFRADGKAMYILRVNDDMTAMVRLYSEQIEGSLKLAGATTDTVLYQFQNIKIEGKPNIDDAIVFVRIPRSGLQGDLSGTWMVYFHSDELKKDASYWVYAYPDGTAMSAFRKKANAIVQQDYTLLAWSKEYTWVSSNNVLVMTSAKSGNSAKSDIPN